MLKNSDFRYKLSIGEKFKSVLKTIATIGLTASLMLGATFGISACGKKTPSAEIDPPNQDTPIEPDDPTKPDQPENPDQPDTPDQPTKPDPDQPVDPDDPSKPGDKDPDDDKQEPVEPTFELNAKTKAEIEENLNSTLTRISLKNDSKLLQAYLRPSETGVVDTLGCVITTDNGAGFIYSEIKVLKLTENLTWKQLSETGLGLTNYNVKTCKITPVFDIKSQISKIDNYDDSYVDDAFKKVFEMNDEDLNLALFTGWTYSGGIVDAAHRFTLIKDNKIYNTEIVVDNNGKGLFNAFVENYLNAKDNSKWTQTAITETQLIPTEYLDYVVDFTDKETTAENQ